MAVNIAIQPISEPVTVNELKEQTEYGLDDRDSYMSAIITAARQWCEEYTNRAFITQTLTVTLSGFGGHDEVIDLPRAPLQSVLSIAYVDTDGNTQTLDSSAYQVDATTTPGRIAPEYGYQWPSTSIYKLSPVVISIVAGYGTADKVPTPIKQAILMLAGHLFQNREAVSVVQLHNVPFAVETLLSPYRIITIA